MAYSTRLQLVNGNAEQPTGKALNLSGTTRFGNAEYLTGMPVSYTCKTIPDVAFVTGQTKDLRDDVTYISGVTSENIADINALGAISGITNASITGATNGLTKVDNHCAKLGGVLCENTTISGDSYILRFGTLSSCLNGFYVESDSTQLQGSSIYINGLNNAALNGGNIRICLTNDCGLITDNRGIGYRYGLEYAADYSDDFKANSLVTKKYVCSQVSGISTNAIIAANNGLTKNNQTAELGGTLTKNTTINLSTFDLIFSGDSVQYGANYSSTYTQRSLVDAGYVTGLTNGLDSRLDVIESNYITGATDGISAETTTHRVGLTLANRNILNNAITEVTNGLTKVDNHCAKLGGELTDNTCIYGSQVFTLHADEIDFCGGSYGINLDGDVFLVNLVGGGSLLTINPTTGKVETTSIGSIGITGGTNGITDCGDANLGLGGALCTSTSICGAGYDLSLGTAGSKLNAFVVNAAGTSTISSGTLEISSSGATFTDLRSGTGRTGIVYADDYSTAFVDNSLVTKKYVDTIATGLIPHAAVKVATTENITLSGLQTIDGVSVGAGDRVLVKNQTNKAQNGIYIAASGSWTRSSDYDGSPQGEVSSGDLIPVLSGDTQALTVWILTTPNPITVGTTELEFTKFTKLLGVTAGEGISITTVGSTQTVSVDLASNSGLEFVSNKLSINDNIAGTGLSWNNGILNVNAASGGVAGISVKYDDSDNLVINATDIDNALGGVITDANNGLTKDGHTVKFGGTLTQPTSLSGNNVNMLIYYDTSISNSNRRGILYGGAASGYTFVDNSLVNKYYVDSLTNNLDSRLDIIEPDYVTGATNGLTKLSCHEIGLGGNLTKNTVIDLTGNTFTIVGAANVCFLNFDDTGAVPSVFFGISHGNGVAQIYSGFLSMNGSVVDIGNSYLRLRFSPTGTTITDNTASPSGLTYADCYHTTYTERSLVDKEYVDKNITGATDNIMSHIEYISGVTSENIEDIQFLASISGNTVTGATNGLTKFSCYDIGLGGKLCADYTVISGDNKSFLLGLENSEMNEFCVYTNLFNINSTAGSIGGDSYDIYITSNNSINITPLTDGCVSINTANFIYNSPNDMTETFDYVLGWNMTTGFVGSINPSVLGEHNNKYSITAVTSNVTLTASQHVVLVDSSGGEITITLPSTPDKGQVYKIKDMTGSALSNPITIKSNVEGILIDDNVSVMINTDYGAIEVMYSEDNGRSMWYVLSFVN